MSLSQAGFLIEKVCLLSTCRHHTSKATARLQ